jgi:hypothetical protein
MEPGVSVRAEHPDERRSRYLLIGGAPKSGTTSIFHYLADHPEVCPANRKETYFFARDFDFKGVCNVGTTVADFEHYFSHANDPSQLRIEATPYTLYGQTAVNQIAAILPQTTLLFILRDPVDRLFSDYRFATQRENRQVQGKTFAEYVAARLGVSHKLPHTVDLGCYITFLRPFWAAFGKEKVIVHFFEDLQSNPAAVMGALCTAVNIDSNFYHHYHFPIHNQTIKPRSVQLNRLLIRLEPLVANLRAVAMRSPQAHQLFEWAIRTAKLTAGRLNNRQQQRETMPADVRAQLIDYYRPYSEGLQRELERPLPWQSLQ